MQKIPKWRGSRYLGKIPELSRPHSFATRISRVVTGVEARGGESGND